MGKIDTYIAFVKDQVTVQERLARKYDEDDYRRSLHLKTGNSFAALAKFLEEIQKRGTQDIAYLSRGDTPQKRILLTFEDIKDAPDDLLRELNVSDADKQEILVEYLIAEAGGVLSLDKIIIELYRRTGEVPKRTALTARLFRMASRGMIYNVPGKKGVYSTYELTEPEARKMFGQFDGEASDEPESASPAPSAASSLAPTPSATEQRLAPPAHSLATRRRLLGSTASGTIPRS